MGEKRKNGSGYPKWVTTVAGVVIILLLGLVGYLWNKQSEAVEADITANAEALKSIAHELKIIRHLFTEVHPDVARALLSLADTNEVESLEAEEIRKLFSALTFPTFPDPQNVQAEFVYDRLSEFDFLNEAQTTEIGLTFAALDMAAIDDWFSGKDLEAFYKSDVMLKARPSEPLFISFLTESGAMPFLIAAIFFLAILLVVLEALYVQKAKHED